MLLEEKAELFRKKTFCYLGTWHVSKMASTCVWRMYGADFLAPLFHDFFPTSPFPWSPRMVLSTRMFSLIRLAYPDFRYQLDFALNRPALTETQRKHLVNIRSLCEWFIPKVYSPRDALSHIIYIHYLSWLYFPYHLTISIFIYGTTSPHRFACLYYI